jgi:hypothetical protein
MWPGGRGRKVCLGSVRLVWCEYITRGAISYARADAIVQDEVR